MAEPLDRAEVAKRSELVRLNLASLRAAIAAVPRPTTDAVEIVAVTKGHRAETVAACLANGLGLFGENYAQELIDKAAHQALAAARWTFQGRLQTNKITKLAPFVSLWQSVDSLERASALAARVPGAQVLLQLNLTGADQRAGVVLGDADALVDPIRSTGVELLGVMGLGPDPGEEGWTAQRSRSLFEQAVGFADRHGLAVRSLGMSDDFLLAVEAGATMVRIGTALVGPRDVTPRWASASTPPR